MKTQVPYTMCRTGYKRRYANARLASEALAECIRAKAAGDPNRTEWDFYECHKCSGWHLTKQVANRQGGAR